MSRLGHNGSWRAYSSGVSFRCILRRDFRAKRWFFFVLIRTRKATVRAGASGLTLANDTWDPEPRCITACFILRVLKQHSVLKNTLAILVVLRRTTDFLYFLILVSVIGPRKPMRDDANWLEWGVNFNFGEYLGTDMLPSLDSQRPAVSLTNLSEWSSQGRKIN